MAFKDTVADLKTLEWDDRKRLGTSPILLRIFLLLLVLVAVAVGGYYWLVVPMEEKLAKAQRQELELREKFDLEQSKAANLTAYAEQLEEMKRTFKVMLRQLPNKTDIESLLVDLSQTSVASGLEVQYFKPETEIPKEFYAEYPIKVSVTGNYHNFGQFVSGLAALPRIVTLSNIDIGETRNYSAESGESNGGNSRRLKMDITATTYRYIDDEEE